MPIIIDEGQMLEDNVFEFEQKLKSPISRYLDTTPVLVTYYHIDENGSTVDAGFQDVSSLVGFRSPTRFKKIEKLPLYGMDQIILQLQDNDQGLDSEFTGDAITIPGTIDPTSGDYFTIDTLQDSYVFRVTETAYDTAISDGFHRINFQLEYLNKEKIEDINKQVNDTFTCIMENIGTEEKCLIRNVDLLQINKINEMYDDMVKTYLTLFYSERYNSLLGELGTAQKLYDPFQTAFINKHSLFNKKNNLQAIILTDQFTDQRRRIKYEKSFYRVVERRDPKLMKEFKYTTYPATTEKESSFARYYDKSIFILDTPNDMPLDARVMVSNEFATSVQLCGFPKSDYGALIQKFIRKEPISFADIPLTLSEDLIMMDGNLEVFFFTPIVLYIIKTVINDHIKEIK